MIEIKSRKDALETFGPIGLTAWDKFIAGGYYHLFNCPLFDAVFIQPEKLEPLTDEELKETYDDCSSDDFIGALREVVIAHDKRLAEIKEREQ